MMQSPMSSDSRIFVSGISNWREMLGAPLPQRYPEVYDISGSSPEGAAEEVAASERNRLGLGDGPIDDLWGLLEGDVGLRAFAFPMKSSNIAGMFNYTSEYGRLHCRQCKPTC